MNGAWRHFTDSPQHASGYQPPPSDLVRADDERYANEFNTIVATFRTGLESCDCWKFTSRVSAVCRGDFPLAHEQPVIYFCDRWGYPAVLRALARAIEQPVNELGQLEGN